MTNLGKWRVIFSAIVALGVWWYAATLTAISDYNRVPYAVLPDQKLGIVIGLFFGLITYVVLSGFVWLGSRLRKH